MPASNIETIYQFESALESCIETILQTDASLTCYKQKDTDIKSSPWAEVQCTGVSANGKQYKTGSNGFNWPIDFTSTVQIAVTTNREQNTSSHATYLGKVRRYLYDLSTYTTQRLPYLAVSLVSESGSSAVFVDDERFDQTVLQFRVNFTIRHDAWPQEAWTPADIAGLQLWLDASQIVGLNDGDAVGTWSDASGNGYDAAQSTVSRRPLYKTSVLNGKPTVRYDGVDDYLFNATFAQAQPATWFCVAKPTSLAGGSKFVLDSYDGTSRYTLDFEPTTSKWRCYAGNFLSESGTSSLDFKSLVVHYNGASSKITVGGVETSGNAGADGLAGGYVLGCAVSAIGFYFVGDIAEIGCYSRTLTAQELTDVAGYIASKYGL